LVVRGFIGVAFAAHLLMAAGSVRAATLTVLPVSLDPGAVAPVIVTWTTSDESTFGVTILVQLVPRPGNVGTVTFTPAPPSDIGLAGDPWPGVGTFTTFDTDLTGSDLLNGSVDDNGTFLAEPLTYAGLLTGFPITASLNASGTWDVFLSTTAGDSQWEGLATTLTPGTVTVVNSTNVPAVSCWGMCVLVLLTVTAATRLATPPSRRKCAECGR
jgi:hypothetical protein